MMRKNLLDCPKEDAEGRGKGQYSSIYKVVGI